MKKLCKAKLHEFEGKHCKLCSKLKASEYYFKNKSVINKNNKQWMLENKDIRALYKKNYRIKNKEKIKEYKKNYSKYKMQNDIRYKLVHRLRSRLTHIIKGKVKTGSAIKDLGCSIAELRIYLESKFEPGMSWDNYGNKDGNWSIDHIIPLSSVDLEDREQFIKVNHYTNLQPLWHIENMKKGNKLPKEELNKYY